MIKIKVKEVCFDKNKLESDLEKIKEDLNTLLEVSSHLFKSQDVENMNVVEDEPNQTLYYEL